MNSKFVKQNLLINSFNNSFKQNSASLINLSKVQSIKDKSAYQIPMFKLTMKNNKHMRPKQAEQTLQDN